MLPISRDLLLNFGTLLLSPVRMKLQKSNFAAGSRVENAKQKRKIGQKGVWYRSRDLLLNFGIPIISGQDEATNVLLQPDRGLGMLKK